jgi:hypothetical protein
MRSVLIPSLIAWFFTTADEARLMMSRRIDSLTGKASMIATRPR